MQQAESTDMVSIKDAISRGHKTVSRPASVVFYVSVVAGIVLPLSDFSGWFILLLPGSIPLSIVYTSIAALGWRIWAYEHVGDIHQFQRSAELAGLLVRKSHRNISIFAGRKKRRKLSVLIKRFDVDSTFIDDNSVEESTFIYSALSAVSKPEIVLDNKGLFTEITGHLCWRDVYNERIAGITYSRLSPRTGGRISSAPSYLFRFEYPEGGYEIPMSSLAIAAWELDLLIYIYKGRFFATQKD